MDVRNENMYCFLFCAILFPCKNYVCPLEVRLIALMFPRIVFIYLFIYIFLPLFPPKEVCMYVTYSMYPRI